MRSTATGDIAEAARKVDAQLSTHDEALKHLNRTLTASVEELSEELKRQDEFANSSVERLTHVTDKQGQKAEESQAENVRLLDELSASLKTKTDRLADALQQHTKQSTAPQQVQ